MPRGKPSEKSKLDRLLKEASAYLGKEVVLPDETVDDKIAEAQAVHNYIEAPQTFKTRVCKWCGRDFLYRWNRDVIAYCSTLCMAKSLRALGLVWDPARDPHERWGQVLPEVISADAMESLNSYMSKVQADELQYTLFELPGA